mmetsp:Transcript_33478/g.77788  ORF Transcript_33478/g.77788 Transcript_33478/m.77788 type:complete len:366 (+) Transcript_33478:378-1475(+)
MVSALCPRVWSLGPHARGASQARLSCNSPALSMPRRPSSSGTARPWATATSSSSLPHRVKLRGQHMESHGTAVVGTTGTMTGPATAGATPRQTVRPLRTRWSSSSAAAPLTTTRKRRCGNFLPTCRLLSLTVVAWEMPGIHRLSFSHAFATCRTAWSTLRHRRRRVLGRHVAARQSVLRGFWRRIRWMNRHRRSSGIATQTYRRRSCRARWLQQGIPPRLCGPASVMWSRTSWEEAARRGRRRRPHAATATTWSVQWRTSFSRTELTSVRLMRCGTASRGRRKPCLTVATLSASATLPQQSSPASGQRTRTSPAVMATMRTGGTTVTMMTAMAVGAQGTAGLTTLKMLWRSLSVQTTLTSGLPKR